METSGGAEERDRADLLADDVEHHGDASAAGGAAAEDGVGDARDDAEGGRVGRRGGRVVLRRADRRPMLFVGNRLESAPVEMPPSLALTTARHGLRVRRARPRAKYGGEPLRVICRYSSILRVLVVL